MAQYAVARLDEIDEIDDGRARFRPVRHHFGITTFGVTAVTARDDADLLVNEHDEADDLSEELYVVVSGRARFEVDGESHDTPAGTLIYVPPGVKRSARAQEAGTTVMAVGGAPKGKAYEPDGWELFAPLLPLYESGAFEEASDRAQALVADDPPYGALYYNTACVESRAGRIDAALAHLRRALDLSPALRERVREDEDLAALREHPDFTEIVGG